MSYSIHIGGMGTRMAESMWSQFNHNMGMDDEGVVKTNSSLKLNRLYEEISPLKYRPRYPITNFSFLKKHTV